MVEPGEKRSTIVLYLFGSWWRWRRIFDDLKEPSTQKHKELHGRNLRVNCFQLSPSHLLPNWQPLLPGPLGIDYQGLLDINTISLIANKIN